LFNFEAATTMKVQLAKITGGNVGSVITCDPKRPTFKGNGTVDYECASCGLVLAANMSPGQLTDLKLRCGRCNTVNAVTG